MKLSSYTGLRRTARDRRQVCSRLKERLCTHAHQPAAREEQGCWSGNSAMKLREHFKTGTSSCSHHCATFQKIHGRCILCPTLGRKTKKHWAILNPSYKTASPAPQISLSCLQQLDIQKAFVLQNWPSDPCYSWGHTIGFTRSSLVLKYIQQRTICHWLNIWKLMA